MITVRPPNKSPAFNPLTINQLAPSGGGYNFVLAACDFITALYSGRDLLRRQLILHCIAVVVVVLVRGIRNGK